jgi:hypothetical protein
MSMVSLHPLKAKDLAGRVEFLTEHIPGLSVIVTGESNGAIMADSVMSILRDNPQVYSIQTGPPFWYTNKVKERTLVLREGGIIPDSFSSGDIFAIIAANLEVLFGFPRPVASSGNIMFFINAPGHEYWWQYPEVHTQIINFLQGHFGTG